MKNFLFLVAFGSIVWNCTKPVPPEPQKTLAILSVSALPSVNALALTANISSNGNSTITERGCYVSSVAGQHTESATCTKFIVVGNDIFTKTVDNLISNTNYYITAYAVNEVGTAYSLEIVAKTGLKPPVFSAISIADITKNSARLFGTFEVFAGSIPTSMGLEYRLSDNGVTPVGEVIKTQSVAFTGTTPGTYNFEFLFTDGAPGQIYLVKAYCIVPDSKIYGSEKFFTLNGYKYGMIIDGDIVVAVYNNGGDGKALHIQELKNTTVSSPYRPSWGWYAGYFAGTSTIAGSGPANTIAITSATPAQVYQGVIDPLGAAYLCRDLVNGSHSDYFLPSKGDYQEIMDHLKDIFKTQTYMNSIIKSNYYTSSENGTDYYYSVGLGYVEGDNHGFFLTTVKMGITDGFGNPACMAMRNLPHCD